jgi:hypothetical protein
VKFVETSEKNRDIPSLGLRKNYRVGKIPICSKRLMSCDERL